MTLRRLAPHTCSWIPTGAIRTPCIPTSEVGRCWQHSRSRYWIWRGKGSDDTRSMSDEGIGGAAWEC